MLPSAGCLPSADLTHGAALSCPPHLALQFHLEQAKQRTQQRLAAGRPKPIDRLAHGLFVLEDIDPFMVRFEWWERIVGMGRLLCRTLLGAAPGAVQRVHVGPPQPHSPPLRLPRPTTGCRTTPPRWSPGAACGS